MSGTTAPVVQRSELPVRIVSGVAMILVAVGALAVGGLPFLLLVAAAGLLIMAEWAGLMRARRWQVALAVLFAALTLAAAGTGIVDAYLPPPPWPWGPTLWSAIGAAALATATLSFRLGVGLLYATLPAVALLFIRAQPDGVMLTFWTLAVVWATDIGAYFAGRAIGGPKLAPRLSPNKTWAGLIGGMAAALAVGFAIAAAGNVPYRLAALGGLLAAAAQAGDLFESWLKRRAGVKDSGRLLPGHGGAMDRLDGLVPVACIVALLIARGFV